MGLDVGTVRFDYSHPPKGACVKFAWYLAHNYDDADWGLAEGGNTLSQHLPETLERLAEEFAESEGMRREEREAVMGWVKALPYDNGAVTLHFSV